MNQKPKSTSNPSEMTPNRFLKTRLDSRIKGHCNKENDSLSINSVVTVSSTPWKSSMLKQKSCFLHDATEEKLNQYIKDNEKLKEKIKTHEAME